MSCTSSSRIPSQTHLACLRNCLTRLMSATESSQSSSSGRRTPIPRWRPCRKSSSKAPQRCSCAQKTLKSRARQAKTPQSTRVTQAPAVRTCQRQRLSSLLPSRSRKACAARYPSLLDNSSSCRTKSRKTCSLSAWKSQPKLTKMVFRA